MPDRPHSSGLRAIRRALQPLGRKLPLLISGLLILVVAAYGWIANARARAAVEAAAGERLGTAARDVAEMLGMSVSERLAITRELAAEPALLRALVDPDPAAANAAMSPLGRPVEESARVASRALWARDCRLVAAIGPLSAGGACPAKSASIGRAGAFRPHDEGMVYDIVFPVLAVTGDTAGFIVDTRRTTGGGAGRIGRLIGAGGKLLVTDPRGSVWTDMVRPVPGPPVVPARGIVSAGVDAAGRRAIQVTADVPGADWVVMVEMPYATVQAPLDDLLATLLLVALGCIVVGALGAYLISRHVTAPIADIQRAAERIGAGDYTQRVAVRRSDELGELGDAFNAMAAHVESARTLLDDLIACAPVGVAVFDTGLRYLKVNDAMAALTGRPTAEHIGRYAGDVEPAMGEHIEPLLEHVVATGQPVLNRRLATPDEGTGQRHWLATVFPVRDEGGTVSGAGLLALDTTAHQELELRYLQAQKMDAVGRLAGGVAHDFNNLLTVILSYSAMTIDALPRSNPLRADIEEIRDAGARAAALTRQLLAFSRNAVLQPRLVNLNTVATNMERMLRRLIGEDVLLVLDLAPDLHDVHADPGQLEQIIMNLAVNARDAMPGGGRLYLETRNRHVSAEMSLRSGTGAGEFVTLTVRDEGVGMSHEVQAHLFEPFYTTKPAGQGTGLGLATVYGIVKQSGGEIQVTSSPGAGTTVTVHLPRALTQADGAHDRSAHDGAPGTETVLLVEDDPALQALGTRVLRRAGYRVLGAQSPEDALAIGRSFAGRIDLLLTDVVMPGMHGGAVADELERIRPGIRTLYMSGYPDDEVRRRGVVAEPSAFLQKPFTPAELTRRVRDALDARTARSA